MFDWSEGLKVSKGAAFGERNTCGSDPVSLPSSPSQVGLGSLLVWVLRLLVSVFLLTKPLKSRCIIPLGFHDNLSSMKGYCRPKETGWRKMFDAPKRAILAAEPWFSRQENHVSDVPRIPLTKEATLHAPSYGACGASSISAVPFG